MKRILYILLLITSLHGFSQNQYQGLPFITNYTPKDYNKPPQNWSVVEDTRGKMYFGNGGFVLEYDGNTWLPIAVKNNSTVRSLAIDQYGTIYVGAVGEFGCLIPTETGSLEYFSFVYQLDSIQQQFTDVWQVLVIEDFVYFRTNVELIRFPLYKFQEEKNMHEQIKTWKPQRAFHFLFHVNGKTYIRERGVGLMELANDKLQLVTAGENFAEESIYSMLPFETQKELLITKANGLMVYSHSKAIEDKEIFTILPTPANNILKENNMYGGIPYSNDNFLINTMRGGLFVTDKQGNILGQYNQDKGINDNTVWYVYNSHNQLDTKPIWLALNNGISKIELNSPLRFWGEKLGLQGTVNDIIRCNEILYIATTLGVYFWNNETEHFEAIKGMPNECSSLLVFTPNSAVNQKQTLLVSSTSGVYQIINQTVTQIAELRDVFKLYQSKQNPNKIFAGALSGLEVFKYENNRWIDEGVILSNEGVIRRFAEDEEGNLWLGTKYQGVIRLDNSFVKQPQLQQPTEQQIKYFDTLSGLPNLKDVFPILFNKQIIVATEKGFYRLNQQTQKFDYINLFGNTFKDSLLSVDVFVQDKMGNCWSGSDTRIFGAFKKNQQFEIDSMSFLRLGKMPVYSIYSEDNGIVWIGGTEGLYSFDSKYIKNYQQNYNALIRQVFIGKNDSSVFNGNNFTTDKTKTKRFISLLQPDELRKTFDYENNKVTILYVAPYFENEEAVLFSYYLEGQDNNWSKWTSETYQVFTNLSEGRYTFHVKAKNVYGIESKEATYSFTILPPWYRTFWAYTFYFIVAVFFVLTVVKLYTRRLLKEKENLERIVKERTAEVVRQKEDIQMKNVILEQQKEEITVQAEQLQEANVAITEQKEQIQEKNKEITDSINYASYIQAAMLPQLETLTRSIPDSFVLFKPRDIVSGDFYWFTEHCNKIIVTAVDCTGHGVPGALMSMMGDAYLNQIINSRNIVESNQILHELNESIRKALKQDETQNRDGMDMALCVIDKEKKQLEFSGAKNPLIYIQNNELVEIKGDKNAIGGFQKGVITYTKNIVDISQETCIYVFSDGYQDQFGGPKERKFLIKNLKDLLLQIHKKPMTEQKQILKQTIEDWLGTEYRQIDDILVIGARIVI